MSNTEITSQINLENPEAVEAFLAAQPIKYHKSCGGIKTYYFTKTENLRCRCVSCDDSNNTKKLERDAELALSWKLKAGNKCNLCGFNAHPILEWHHIESHLKEACIARMPIYKQAEEVAKCILLCKNCHGIAHLAYIDSPEYRAFLFETKHRIEREVLVLLEARENQNIVV